MKRAKAFRKYLKLIFIIVVLYTMFLARHYIYCSERGEIEVKTLETYLKGYHDGLKDAKSSNKTVPNKVVVPEDVPRKREYIESYARGYVEAWLNSKLPPRKFGYKEFIRFEWGGTPVPCIVVNIPDLDIYNVIFVKVD